MRTAVIYEGPTGTPVDTDSIVVVGVPGDGVVDAARRLVAEGADRVEICGGLGPVPLAAVRAAVGDVPVGGVMFGFESLERVTDHKTRFAAGEARRAALVHLDLTAGPEGRRVDVAGDAVIGVPDASALARLVVGLEAEGFTLVELYGGLGPEAASEALAATGGRVPVGLALYPHP